MAGAFERTARPGPAHETADPAPSDGADEAADRGPIGVIVNPVAGGGRALRLLPRLVAALSDRPGLCSVHVTTAPGEATAVAAAFAAAGMRLVVAVGGDGTVNEVANGLVGPGRPPTTLGVVPAGRGGDFARSVGLARNPAVALARLRVGRARRVDVGRAEFGDGSSRLLTNVGGVGFDAEVARRAARSRLPGTTAPYLAGIAGALRHLRTRRVEVATDGGSFSGEALAIVVANGHSFGGGIRIVPDADPNDGCLDVAIIGNVSRRELVRQVPGVYRGAHVRHPRFALLRATMVRIESDGPMPVQLDGEGVGAAPVTFVVVPAALRVLV